MALHIFHDNDGVVHHETDREHDREEGEKVDREAEQEHQERCTDERDGDGDDRDQRGADGAQEKVDDEDDQQQRFAEGFPDLVNGIPDVFRIIVRHGDFHACRELFLDFGQRGADGLDDIERVCGGQHPDPDEGRFLAVEADVRVVTLRAQLDVGDVFEPHDGVVLLPDHQLAEFLGGFEIGVGHQIHGNHRALGGAERGEIVVIGQGLAGLRGRDIQRGHAVGL